MNKKTTDAPVIASDAPINQFDRISGSKGKNFSAQFQICYNAFSERPKTMAEVANETGIWRSNITRYIGTMKRQGLIKLVRKDVCPISGMSNVGFYQTNANVQPAPYVAAPVDAPISHSIPAPVSSGSAFDELRKTGDYCYQLF